MDKNDLGSFVDRLTGRLARGTRTWATPAAVAAGSMFGAAQAQSAYVCEPGTVPNVSEARTTSAINELEDTIAQNLPNHVPRIAGSDKLVINFEGSGPVTDERIGHDVTFALVNVGTNVMQGDGSSTQRFGMNNEGQYVQTFRIEGDELYGLKNVVESMCVNYEIEIGVRAPDGSVIDASLRHNAGSADAPEIGLIGPRGTDQDGMRIGPDGFVIYGDITPAGTRRIANGKEGMASAVRVDLGELTRDVLLESGARAHFFTANTDIEYAIGGDSLFIAAAADATGTQTLGTLVLSDGTRSAEYELTMQVGPTAENYSIESHVDSELTAGQIAQNRAINTFAHTLGSLVDSYGFKLGGEGSEAPLRFYGSAGELEGDLARRGIHRIELDPHTGNVDLFYRLDPNNRTEQERSMQLIYTGEQGSFDHMLAVANLYASMAQPGLDYDHEAVPNQLR
jgi:hypothetical protein